MMADKTKIMGLVSLPVLLFCLTFTLENVDVYKADKPAVCIDDSGWIYLVGNHSGNDIVKFIKKSTGAWSQDSLLFSVVSSTGYNSRSSAAAGPNKTLHILYRVQGGTYGWPVYTNNISGSFTTCDTLLKISSLSTFHYGIAVDNLNHAHIVCEMYSGSYYLYYFYPYHPDSMVSLVTNAGDPTIAVAQDNTVHIAYLSTTNSKIYYLNNVGGAFGAPVLVSDTTGVDPSIAVDNAGKAHICWTSGNVVASSNLFYATNKTGTFQTTKITSNGYYGYSTIALDKDNDVAIEYWKNTGVWNDSASIWFASKKAADAVFTVDSVDKAYDNPSYGSITWNDRALAFDSLQIAHFTYQGKVSGQNTIMYGKTTSPIGVDETVSVLLPKIQLQCYPNPGKAPVTIFSHSTAYVLIPLEVYDITGRIVRDLGEAYDDRAVWDGKDSKGCQVPGGVYLIKAKGFSNSAKLVIIE
jgi:hypothetical protein